MTKLATLTSDQARWRRLLGAIPILLALPVLLHHASAIHPYMADDSLIVARYAERLIEGHGLTWTDGERVEGYSNLLWTVSVAAIGALIGDVLDAARLLGVLCMASVFVALACAYKPRTLAELVPVTVAALLFASAGPIRVWAIGGLEQSMVAALLAWALVAVFPILDGPEWRPEGTQEGRGAPQDAKHFGGGVPAPSRNPYRSALLVGIPLALLCWTRPDGPLFTAVFAGITVLQFKLRRTGWLLALRMTVLPVLAVAMQLAFRLIYYGDWLPNPAYIKARVASDRLDAGLDYVIGGWEWMVPALVLTVLSLVVSFVAKHQRGRSSLLLCCFFAWAAYLVSIGGDIFAGRRHLVPLWLLLTFMVAPGLDWIIRRNRVWLTLLVAALSLAAVHRLGEQQTEDPKVRQAKRQTWQWEGEILARVLGEGFREQRPLLAVTAAGTLPYFSKLPCLDMLGLNDRHIARQRPEQAGDLAHDHADAKYVLDREPDLIVFTLGQSPGFAVGRQMVRDPRFKRDYMPVVFRGYVPHEREGRVYVRTHGRVGMQFEDDFVTVPGYLLQGKGVLAQPGVDGGIEAVIPANAKLASKPLPLGRGTWQVTVSPPNPDVDVSLHVGSHRGQVLSVNGNEQVRVRVTSRGASSLLGTIRIERVSDDVFATPNATVLATPNYSTKSIGSFNKGLNGWRKKGNAFKNNPSSRKRKRQAKITGNVGKFLNSYGPKTGDKPIGTLTSKRFTVTEGMVLSFRVGGGKFWRVGVRLMEGNRTLMTWRGANSEKLAQVRFGLTPYAGRRLRVEVFDESRGTWGHVLADEFELLTPEPAGTD